MDPRVHFLTLSTPDLDAAREFYVRGLGWEPLLDVPGEILFFRIAPGTVLGLFDAAKFAEDLSPDEMEKVLEEQGKVQDRIEAAVAFDLATHRGSDDCPDHIGPAFHRTSSI